MFLNARSDLFKVELPRTFIPKHIKEKYEPYVFRMPTMINDVSDLINYTIQTVTIPTMNYTPVEQVKPQEKNRFAQEEPAPNSLGQSSTEAGRIRRWRSSNNVQEIFTKEFQVTFQLIDGHINYWILLDTLLYYYDFKNKKRFTENIPVRILDAEGNVMFTALFTDVLFTGLTEYQLSYSDLSQEFKTFDATFQYNTLNLELLPADNINKNRFIDGGALLDNSTESSFPAAATGSTGSTASPSPPLFDTTSFRFNGNQAYLQSQNAPFTTLNLQDKWTISFWLNLADLSTDQPLMFLVSNLGNLYAEVDTSGTVEVSFPANSSKTKSNVNLVAGQWAHVCLRLDGTLANPTDRLQIWINGSNVSTSSFSGPANIGLATSAYFFGTNITEFMNGWMSELSFFVGDVNPLAIYNQNSGLPGDLNNFSPLPTNWFRSENAEWDGSQWTVVDEMGTGIELKSDFMTAADRTNEVPS